MNVKIATKNKSKGNNKILKNIYFFLYFLCQNKDGPVA